MQDIISDQEFAGLILQVEVNFLWTPVTYNIIFIHEMSKLQGSWKQRCLAAQTKNFLNKFY